MLALTYANPRPERLLVDHRHAILFRFVLLLFFILFSCALLWVSTPCDALRTSYAAGCGHWALSDSSASVDARASENAHIRVRTREEKQTFLRELRYAASMAVIDNQHRFRRVLQSLRHVDTADRSSPCLELPAAVGPVAVGARAECQPLPLAASWTGEQRGIDHRALGAEEQPMPVQIDAASVKQRPGSVAVHVHMVCCAPSRAARHA